MFQDWSARERRHGRNDVPQLCEDFGGPFGYDKFAAAEQRVADLRYARPVALWGGK